MSDASDETIRETDTENESEIVIKDVEGATLIKTLLTTEKVNVYYNKLHLLRSDFKYINLVGHDGCMLTYYYNFIYLLYNIKTSSFLYINQHIYTYVYLGP